MVVLLLFGSLLALVLLLFLFPKRIKRQRCVKNFIKSNFRTSVSTGPCTLRRRVRRKRTRKVGRGKERIQLGDLRARKGMKQTRRKR